LLQLNPCNQSTNPTPMPTVGPLAQPLASTAPDRPCTCQVELRYGLALGQAYRSASRNHAYRGWTNYAESCA
jgi:hypothetical protein